MLFQLRCSSMGGELSSGISCLASCSMAHARFSSSCLTLSSHAGTHKPCCCFSSCALLSARLSLPDSAPG